MDILKYFKEVKAQRQINRLARKFKGKKIVIYGAGEYFKILYDNYDLSKLNIIGIADKKFEVSKDNNFTRYKALEPIELKEFEFDVILVALYDDTFMLDRLKYDMLINTINENSVVAPIIEPTLFYMIKVLMGK